MYLMAASIEPWTAHSPLQSSTSSGWTQSTHTRMHACTHTHTPVDRHWLHTGFRTVGL